MRTSPFKLTPAWGLICVVMASLLVMSPSLFNGWVNWDDDHYVLNNPLVQSLSIGQIGEMFSTLQVQGNYHPLTLLSLAIDYQIAGTDPFMFHATNLLLHLLNTALVFGFVYLLMKRIWIAVITALLFGIHPMHVESVAWISERKDVLYTFFFLGGLRLYLTYLQAERKKYLWLALSMLAFVLSLLSKGMAVTFPLILCLIDYVYKRTDYRRLILEKIPFLLISLGFGVLTIIAQRAGQALSHAPDISFVESLATASYGMSLYTIKALIPVHLSTLHPYPMMVGEAMPAYMYLSVLFAAALLYLVWRGIPRSREFGFGAGLYLISLAPVLQLLPVGNAMIAERYTYIAYIGLFFLLGWGVDQFVQGWNNNKQSQRIGGVILLGVYVLLMMLSTIWRIPVWKNGESLWTDVMEKYPDHYYSYASRSMYWIQQNLPQKALADVNEALIRNPGFADGFVNRGMLFAQRGEYERAVADYDQAILLDSMNHLPYLNRGAVLRISNRPKEALRDLSRSIELDPAVVMSYHNRGILYRQQKQFDAAIQDFSAALNLEASNPVLWFERGWVEALAGNLYAAEQDFSEAIRLKSDYAQAYFYRSLAYREQKQTEKALQDALTARELGLQVEEMYLEELRNQ
ncbi:MAG: tetratricopeptide repeat protein [Bacteroidota bacterium]